MSDMEDIMAEARAEELERRFGPRCDICCEHSGDYYHTEDRMTVCKNCDVHECDGCWRRYGVEDGLTDVQVGTMKGRLCPECMAKLKRIVEGEE